MKLFFLVTNILTLTVLLIILFQNIPNSFNLSVLFFTINSGFTGVLILLGLGFFAGLLAAGLGISVLNSNNNDEEAGGASWQN
ncbi:hypothetical protein GF376_03850 [Candidatus Peregrinibacteria bacterium]|nr:hypothetical protein [Candidatus Peregrinibacteria bacterium]